MLTRHTRNGITWVDLEAPTREELREIMDEFGIDSRVEEEIIAPTPYPLVLASPKYVYMVLHFPTTNPQGGARNQELDFIVGKKFMITARYEVIQSVHSLHRVFEAEELLKLSVRSKYADVLIERVLRHVYNAIREHLEHTARTLDKIEEEIFAGNERRMVRTLSLAGRVLLRFDTTLARHKEPLREFLETLSSPSFFGTAFATNAAHIEAEHTHTAGIVNAYRAVAFELRTTNESLLSAAQNEVMKRLTVMAFLTFPLTLIATIFAMDTVHMPIVGMPYDFWIIIGIMALVVITSLTFFKHRKWL